MQSFWSYSVGESEREMGGFFSFLHSSGWRRTF